MKLNFSAIKQNVSITDTVRAYGIDVNHSEMCNCPFHGEKTPSMKLYTDSNQYHCYGCGEHGDVIDFVSKMENISVYKAAEKLNQQFGLSSYTPSPQYSRQPVQEKTEPEQDYTGLFRQANFYLNRTDYHRGISTETLNRFQVGFLSEWRHPKSPASVPASPRLIIPTSKSSYLARDTRPVLTESQKKYAKSKVGKVHIFNQEALQNTKKPVFVVEGEIDAMSIIDVGGEAVALGSVANVNKFLELARNQKPTQPIIIVRDNDPSGIKGANNLAEGLKRLGIPCYQSDLAAPYKDVNEALMADRETLKYRVGQAEHIPWLNNAFTVVNNYYKILQRWEAVCTPDSPLFQESVSNKSATEALLNGFSQKSYSELKPEIEKIAFRLREIMQKGLHKIQPHQAVQKEMKPPQPQNTKGMMKHARR